MAYVVIPWDQLRLLRLLIEAGGSVPVPTQETYKRVYEVLERGGSVVMAEGRVSITESGVLLANSAASSREAYDGRVWLPEPT